MKFGVAIVVKDLQGKILLVKEEAIWSLPSIECSDLAYRNYAETLAVDVVKEATGINMYSFNHCGDYLSTMDTVYKVYTSITDERVIKITEYMWINENNLPDNLGLLTKHQLKKELKASLLLMAGNKEKLQTHY